MVPSAAHHDIPWNAVWACAQAIGSILALVVAIALPQIQRAGDRDEFRKTVGGYADLVHEAIRALAIYSGVFTEVVAKLPLQQTGVELKLPRILDAAEALPLDRLGSSESVLLFTRLIGSARTFIETTPVNAPDCEQAEYINGVTVRRYAAERVVDLHRQLHEALAGPSRRLFVRRPPDHPIAVAGPGFH